ncbi:NfeD family protein [Cellulomonas hominis]
MGWLWWLGGALLLGIGEMLTLDLLFLMLAGGALGGAVANLIGLPIGWQVAVAAVTSLLLLFALRPWLLRHLRARTPLQETNSAALVGRAASVVATTDAAGGRIKLAGEVWSARSADAGVSFAPGAPVLVRRIDGATAVVEAAQPAPPPDA